MARKDDLNAALIALAQGHGTVVNHYETPWASVIFTGTRHQVELKFSGEDAVRAGECLVAFLPDHEFGKMPDRTSVVVDAFAGLVDYRLWETPVLFVVCELLLVEEPERARKAVG
jgi:hypothetical protein